MNQLIRSKMILASAAFIAAVVLLLLNKIDSTQWVSTTTWVLGLYFSAQVAETAVTKKPPDTPV